MTTKTYVGDTGTVITLDCGQNISAATARSIAYTTLANSLDQNGTWLLQAVVSLGGGTWRGETAQLTVYSPFA